MAIKQAKIMQVDKQSDTWESRVAQVSGPMSDLRVTYHIGMPDASGLLSRVTVGSVGINLETDLQVVEAEEVFIMDAERQKLELDITKEFEFADQEATSLIDDA